MGSSESSFFAETIEVLRTKDLSSEEESFWEKLISHPESSAEVFSTLNLSFLRDVPLNNLIALLDNCKRIVSKISEANHPRQTVLNSVRITTRVLAFILAFPAETQILLEKDYPFELISALMFGFFTKGFTLEDEGGLNRYNLDINRLWSAQIFGEVAPSLSYEMQENRTELMNCLISAFTGSLYVTYEEASHYSNFWIQTASSYQMPHCKDLFFSLLEVIITHNNAGYIPYSGYIYKDLETYPIAAAQLLLILLDNKSETNIYIDCVRELSSSMYEFVFANIHRLLSEILTDSSSYIPSSVKSIDYHTEVLLLFWHLIDLNEGFKEFVCNDDRIKRIIEILMIYYERTDNVGEFQLSVFIIFALSSNREFSSNFSEKFDRLMKVTYDVILHRPLLEPLVNVVMTLLNNISPFVKHIGRTGSQNLIGIFEHFTLPKFILTKKENRQLLYITISLINNRLQYQWDGSIELVYALLSSRTIFDKFRELSKGNECPIEITDEWQEWKETLPLNLIEIMLDDIMPRLDKAVKKTNYANDTVVVEFLQSTTMVGLFPTPQEISLVKYVENRDSLSWFKAFLWGIVFVRYQKYGLINIILIKIFKVLSNFS